MKIKRLMALLDYSFKNAALLETALRHRSVGKPHNERFEFLGDSILNFVIANKLFEKFSKASEGELTRLRATLVNRVSLAEIAFNIDISSVIVLGVGEKKSGGFSRESILADAIEAIIAAVYLDGGMDSAIKLIDHLYKDKFEQATLLSLTKDPKTKLQEWLQAKKKALPVYTVLSNENHGQDAYFIIECVIDGLDSVRGEGPSRRIAEQQAAQAALEKLSDEF